MLFASFCIVASLVGVAYTSYQDVPSKPVDVIHTWQNSSGIVVQPYVPQLWTAYCVIRALYACVYFYGTVLETFKTIYAPAMLIKAILGAVTLIPDADPRCQGPYDPTICFTRNDMMPSGHMLLACSVACITHWSPSDTILAILVGGTLILAKTHYTADVLMAALLIVLFYTIQQQKKNTTL